MSMGDTPKPSSSANLSPDQSTLTEREGEDTSTLISLARPPPSPGRLSLSVVVPGLHQVSEEATKESPVEEVKSLPDTDVWNSTVTAAVWQISFQQAPILPILSLLLVPLLTVTSVGVLLLASGDSTSNWTIQPAVYLSIITTSAGVFLRYTFSDAAAVIWWISALHGCTVRQLHETWHSSQSLTAALSALYSRRKTAAAFLGSATLATFMFAANGPLLQRSSQVLLENSTIASSITLPIATRFVPGWSGWAMQFAGVPSLSLGLSSETLSLVMRNYEARSAIVFPSAGCIGADAFHSSATCRIQMPGLAFNISCVTSNAMVPDPSNSEVFKVAFTAIDSMINMTTMFPPAFPNQTCLTQNSQIPATQCTCILTPSLVWYPVDVAMDGTATLSNATETSGDSSFTFPADPEFMQSVSADPGDLPELDTGNIGYFVSIIGGFLTAFTFKFSSIAFALNETVGIVPKLIFSASGPLVFDFLTTFDTKNDSVCAFAFNDPTSDIISEIRQVMFRVTLAAAVTNGMNMTLDATLSGLRNVFHTNPSFLIASVVLQIVCFMLVLSAFWGFWNLGHRVSFSPLEIAKAFENGSRNAQSTLGGTRGTNLSVSELVEVIGDATVLYGEVGEGSNILAIGLTDVINPPVRGQVYQ